MEAKESLSALAVEEAHILSAIVLVSPLILLASLSLLFAQRERGGSIYFAGFILDEWWSMKASS